LAEKTVIAEKRWRFLHFMMNKVVMLNEIEKKNLKFHNHEFCSLKVFEIIFEFIL